MPGCLPDIPSFFPAKLQDLPPAAARLCLSVEHFLTADQAVSLQGTFVTGFSGGADSCALLLILHSLAQKNGCEVIAAHLDHGLRPGSGAEAAWCQKFCERLNIFCAVRRVNGLEGRPGSVENNARDERYAFLEEVRQNRQGNWICTGHQLNDLGEDVFMRLCRGTGWPALAGMTARCDNRKLLRPLLLIPRNELEIFLRSLNVPWLIDESNASDTFFRNRVRRSVIPFMEAENPAFLDNIAGLWQQAEIDRAFFQEQIPGPFFIQESGKGDGNKYSERSVVAGMAKALRLRYYKRCLEALGAGHVRMSQLFALDAAWHGEKFPKIIQFCGKTEAVVYKQRIIWRNKRPVKNLPPEDA